MTTASGLPLPGGAMVGLDNNRWPAFTGAMPWAAKIEEYPASKASKVVADNTSTIESELDKWNKSVGWPLPPPNCPMPPVGSGGVTEARAASQVGRDSPRIRERRRWPRT